MTTMSSDNPWRDIETPKESGSFSARRIADVGSSAWGLYWAVDSHRQCLLILKHHARYRSSHRLPTLRGLRVEVQSTDEPRGTLVILRLTDADHEDLFYRLCQDIVKSTALATLGEEAIDRMLVRTWRWHRLLRGGRDGRLSAEEQKGLIGELLVLEKHLLPVLGPVDAVRGWVGPLGAPKDFQVGPISVEAKACAPLAAKLSISSPAQLDSTEEARLFLHVTEVAPALEDSASAVTIEDIVRRTREMISAQDLAAVIEFEERLLAMGFDWAHDYSDRRWMVGAESLYEVAEGFPRITSETVPSGVDDVRYAIVLSQCKDHRVQGTTLADAVCGGYDGDS